MYRYLLASLLIFIVVGKASFNKLAKSGYHPQLSVNSTNLSQHLIAKDLHSKKIIMLGNSSVKGNDIPSGNNIAHHLNKHLTSHRAYNLGVLGASTSALMALFKQSLEYDPKVLVIGINPGLLATLPGGIIEHSYLEELKGDLPPPVFSFLEKDKVLKSNFLTGKSKDNKVSFPPKALTSFKTFLYKLQVKLYGYTMASNIWGSKGPIVTDLAKEGRNNLIILKRILTLANERRIKVIIYLDPTYKVEKSYDSRMFAKFKLEIEKELAPLSNAFLNYNNFLASNSENFFDYIHLNPIGNKKFAQKLFQDIKDLIGD